MGVRGSAGCALIHAVCRLTACSVACGKPMALSLHHAVQVYGLEPENWDKSALSIVVVGASGDLAKKKIYPALFALYVEVGVVMCSVLCWPALYMGPLPALVALWHAWCEEVGASS